MGLADREYYRGGGQTGRPGRPAGVGTAGPLSVNTWIMIICIVIFVLGKVFAQNGVPVLHSLQVVGEAKQIGIVGGAGEYWLDPSFRSVAAPGQVRQVGYPLFRPLIDTTLTPPQQVGIAQYVVMDPLTAYGHFSTAVGFQRLEVWRLVTFQFLHANWIHLFMNMFGLWIFGGMVERGLGRKRYLAFYLVCGIFGGLMYLALNFVGGVMGVRLPGVLINDTHVPLVGASAGVFGVIMACAYLAPREVVYLLFPPMPVRLMYLAYGYVGIAVLNLVMGGANAGGDAAHVGGALAGAYFIRRPHLLRDFFDVTGDSRAKPPGGRRKKAPRASSSEIDRILDKVRSSSLESLSAEERRILREETERRREGERG
ncbi:MAG: rhomboid family intramembrane serine protease [Phycisphaeraceae bacterium]|nr:rhomboid family intramembrane serine protease [Phycisphaeraceae bacterium]